MKLLLSWLLMTTAASAAEVCVPLDRSQLSEYAWTMRAPLAHVVLHQATGEANVPMASAEGVCFANPVSAVKTVVTVASLRTLEQVEIARAVPPPDPNAELETAIAQATTLSELKDALLGKTRAGKVTGQRP